LAGDHSTNVAARCRPQFVASPMTGRSEHDGPA
jgi:hypothetical protein